MTSLNSHIPPTLFSLFLSLFLSSSTIYLSTNSDAQLSKYVHPECNHSHYLHCSHLDSSYYALFYIITIAYKDAAVPSTKPVELLNSSATLEREGNPGFWWLHEKPCDRMSKVSSPSHQHLTLIHFVCFMKTTDKFGTLLKKTKLHMKKILGHSTILK